MPEEASQKNPRIFVTDCEGPISKNDNAFELTSSFVPDGDSFFALISKYDDVLADVVKKPGYKAGDTLRLILPFLKAYDATDDKIKDFSARNVLLVPGAKDTLTFIRKLIPSFIVSTSYEQYIFSICRLTDFPFENTYCTHLNLDKYDINQEETKRLRELQREIAALPMIEIPKNADSVNDFSERDQATIQRLDEIFWQEIPRMDSGRMLREVNPVGGSEKARAVQDIVEKLKCSLDRVMYVGDSITDVPPLRLVRENGGLSVSFNGNGYAVRESEIAVLSGNTTVTSVLAETFSRHGKEGAFRLVEEWGPLGLEKCCGSPELRERMLRLFPDGFPQVERVTADNMERLKRESSVFRKTVRGEAIG
ncbi:MAG: HAD hydrolase family protein, partial [Candidatus Bathyarchaeota archaeon]|nr:HAD hydrolase family protein [Candidatus Bathyarchaeota archaeon]